MHHGIRWSNTEDTNTNIFNKTDSWCIVGLAICRVKKDIRSLCIFSHPQLQKTILKIVCAEERTKWKNKLDSNLNNRPVRNTDEYGEREWNG